MSSTALRVVHAALLVVHAALLVVHAALLSLYSALRFIYLKQQHTAHYKKKNRLVLVPLILERRYFKRSITPVRLPIFLP